jgi:hypothetical protein
MKKHGSSIIKSMITTFMHGFGQKPRLNCADQELDPRAPHNHVDQQAKTHFGSYPTQTHNAIHRLHYIINSIHPKIQKKKNIHDKPNSWSQAKINKGKKCASLPPSKHNPLPYQSLPSVILITTPIKSSQQKSTQLNNPDSSINSITQIASQSHRTGFPLPVLSVTTHAIHACWRTTPKTT